MGKKNLKIITAVILATLMLTMSGCGYDNPAGTGSGEPGKAAETGLDLIGGSLQYVSEQNDLSKLVSVYDNVQVTCRYMEGATSQTLYFKYGSRGDELGNIWIYTDESGEEEVMGIMGCISFREEDGRIVGQLNTTTYKDTEPSASEISFINPQALIRSIEDQGDTIKVTAPLSEEDLESGPADVYLLDRQTLHLLEYSYINEDGEPLITGEYQYGAGDKGLTDKYISARDKTRRINFEYEKITGSGEHTHSYSSDWKSDSINHWHECSCGDKDDVAAHSFKWVVDKEATATKKGSKHEECKFCGYQRPAVEIPATGSTTKPTDPTESNPNTGALDDVPQTGDNSNMILWIVLLLASGLGVTGTVVYSKRKKYAK